MNILGYNFIVSNNFAYIGIVYVDFYGDDLLKLIIGKNETVYSKCLADQVSRGCSLC